MVVRMQHHIYRDKTDGTGGDGGGAPASGGGGDKSGGGDLGSGVGGSGGDKGTGGDGGQVGKPASGGAGDGGSGGKGDGTGGTPGTDGGTDKDDGGTGKPGVGDKGASKTGEPWWTGDWRNAAAKGDEKALARLARYATPEAAIEALNKLQLKISAGELRSALPKNATAEQITEWRKEQGIPEAPTDYKLALKDGLVVGAEDKPIIDGFLASMHARNMTNEQASAAVDWYYEHITQQTEARAVADKAAEQAMSDQLHKEWGAEFRPNINAMLSLLDGLPAEVRDDFRGGRLADGTPLLAHPGTVKWLVGLAREMNPASALLPNGGDTTVSGIETEIKAIEDKMRTDRKGYNADEKMQQRYRDLLDAKEKMKERGK